MTDFLKTPKTVRLPDLMNIEDEEVKKVLEEYNRLFSEFAINVSSDLEWLYGKIYDLENP